MVKVISVGVVLGFLMLLSINTRCYSLDFYLYILAGLEIVNFWPTCAFWSRSMKLGMVHVWYVGTYLRCRPQLGQGHKEGKIKVKGQIWPKYYITASNNRQVVYKWLVSWWVVNRFSLIAINTYWELNPFKSFITVYMKVVKCWNKCRIICEWLLEIHISWLNSWVV